MVKLSKILVVGLIIVLLGVMIAPTAAQEGEGGIIIDSTFGSSGASTLNPIYCLDTVCSRLISLMMPGLLGIDQETVSIAAGVPGAVAASYTVSEDGLTYTFTLRDDWFWTDGTPITSADFLYYYQALADPTVESPLSFTLSTIESVEAPDPQTLVITFNVNDCTALGNAAFTAVPSHVLPPVGAELLAADYNLNPTVTSGPFQFGALTPEQASLVFNPDYPASDTILGYVSPEGYIQKLVADQTVQVEQFLAGELTTLEFVPLDRRDDIRAAAEAGDVQIYEWVGNTWDYLALNFADPTNPQNGLDENGNPIDQGHHPFFGDPRVRQAIAYGIDVDAIMEAAVFGEGQRMVSSLFPTAPGYNDELEPFPYDPERAAALLDEAGFVDHDGDPATPRIAQGALYAEDGTEFRFELITNQGNSRRETTAQIIQQQLAQIGIAVDFNPLDFNTVLEIMDAQTFDAFILGWRNGFPDDPDQEQLFAASSDVVGSGSNNVSYNNPEFDRLQREAKTVPGCDINERAAIYREAQAIIQQDLPYVWLFSQSGMYAAQANVENWGPLPAQPIWNIDAWAIRAD